MTSERKKKDERSVTNDPARTEFVFVVLAAHTQRERTHKGDTHQEGKGRFLRESAMGSEELEKREAVGDAVRQQKQQHVRSAMCMVALTIQYGVQPLISKRFTGYHRSSSLFLFALNLGPKSCHHPILMLNNYSDVILLSVTEFYLPR